MDEKEDGLPQFMDVHRGMAGITPEQLEEAHQAVYEVRVHA